MQSRPRPPPNLGPSPIELANRQYLLERSKTVGRLCNTMSAIIDKYSQDFDGLADEIQFTSEGTLVAVDNGHIRTMTSDRDHVGEQRRIIQETPQPAPTESDWETDQSDQEMDAAQAESRLSPALSNKENLRPILGDMTSNATSDRLSPPSSPTRENSELVANQLGLGPEVAQKIQSFVDLAKQLVPLFDPNWAPSPESSHQTEPLPRFSSRNHSDLLDSHHPNKRRRLEDPVGPPFLQEGYTSPVLSRNLDSLSLQPPLSALGRFQRAGTPNINSIWSPSDSDNPYYMPKPHGREKRRKKPIPQASRAVPSRLRNELHGNEGSSEWEDQPSEQEVPVAQDLSNETELAYHVSAVGDGVFDFDKTSDDEDAEPGDQTLSFRNKKRMRGPRATYTEEEDRLIRKLYATRDENGMSNAEITAHFPGRTRRQILYRWTTYIRPFLEDGDSEEAISEADSVDIAQARTQKLRGPQHMPEESQSISSSPQQPIHHSPKTINQRPRRVRYEEVAVVISPPKTHQPQRSRKIQLEPRPVSSPAQPSRSDIGAKKVAPLAQPQLKKVQNSNSQPRVRPTPTKSKVSVSSPAQKDPNRRLSKFLMDNDDGSVSDSSVEDEDIVLIAQSPIRSRKHTSHAKI